MTGHPSNFNTHLPIVWAAHVAINVFHGERQTVAVTAVPWDQAMNFQGLASVGVHQDDGLLAIGRFDCLDMLLAGCVCTAELTAFAEICT